MIIGAAVGALGWALLLKRSLLNRPRIERAFDQAFVARFANGVRDKSLWRGHFHLQRSDQPGRIEDHKGLGGVVAADDDAMRRLSFAEACAKMHGASVDLLLEALNHSQALPLAQD
ncbi:MAG: hypothetical protein KGQ57_20755 [Burkholderiales bacterium]|nr:hypothetical protein [Burkholderiales bacterium]